MARILRIAGRSLTCTSLGLLFSHASCARIVQDSAVEGAGLFITNATNNALTLLLWPELSGEADPAGVGADPDDPFEPPVQS